VRAAAPPGRGRGLAALRGGLVVSCQALSGMPFDSPAWVAEMVRAAELGGASGVRVDRPANVTAARAATRLPVVGVYKMREAGREVYITPTRQAALAVAAAGADIVALDATPRPRPDGGRLPDAVAALHAAGVEVLGDIATVDDALFAQDAGVDAVATTLSAAAGVAAEGLVRRLVRAVSVPVLREGGVTTPEEARAALEEGAFAVVVGRAITMPHVIARRFVDAMRALPGPDP
jgi:N-acylglucosamine-6-phosphate 2-epimerase